MINNRKGIRHYWIISCVSLVLASVLNILPVPSYAQQSATDGNYSLRISRVWSDDHIPNRSNPYYSPGKTEALHTAQFSLTGSTISAVSTTDHTRSNARALGDLKVEIRSSNSFRISGTINTQIGVVGLGSFSADFEINGNSISLTNVNSSGLSPNYFPRVQLTRMNAPRTSAPSNIITSLDRAPNERIRAAQTILTEMGLYRSAIDGVTGPGTRRALTDAMAQFGTNQTPTVDNFLTFITTNPKTGIPHLEQLRSQNNSMSSDLEAAQSSIISLNEELELALSQLAQAQASVGTGSAEKLSLVSDQLEVLVTENQDLTSAIEILRNRSRLLDAANGTIADMRDEIARLRPLEEISNQQSERGAVLQGQIDAANATIADLRDGIESDERLIEVRRQLDAANETVAGLRTDIGNRYVPIADYLTLQRQVAALSETAAELRERIDIDYVSLEKFLELQQSRQELERTLRQQLSAANETVAELREVIETNYVPLQKYEEAQRILAAANETTADLRRSLDQEFVPVVEYVRLERQISALNTTILELQERNELQRNRMLESETLFRNFRDDCSENPDCSRAMRLD